MEVNHILRELGGWGNREMGELGNWLSIQLLVFMGFSKLTEYEMFWKELKELENYMIVKSDEQEARKIQVAVSLVFNLCLTLTLTF